LSEFLFPFERPTTIVSAGVSIAAVVSPAAPARAYDQDPLQNMPFRFFLLADLLGFRDMQIPSAVTTTKVEDLYSCSPF
jgi:hypothetical protein